jgi:endonuclease YncB( thermonuclease family)
MRRVLLLAIALAVLAAVPAEARYRAPCLGAGKGGPKCFFWNAKVLSIKDGDTLSVDIAGGGRHEVRVRTTAIQAMEQKVYAKDPSRRRGECHALEATSRFEKLVNASHKHVKLSAQNPKTRSLGRLRRTVWVRYKGHWTSVGAILIREGHALWLPLGDTEWAWNKTYDQIGQEARQTGKNLWNPAYCGNGPHQEVPLRMWINWDPMGVDEQELGAEWVKIQNLSTTTTLALGGWWFRSADYPRLHIPAGTTLGPGEILTIYTGHGRNTNSSLYWNYNKPQWGNPVDKTHEGDAGYLFDPQGDLRLVAQYPCLVACSDPLDGKIGLHVDPGRGGREFSEVTNTSGGDVDLFTYGVRAQGYLYLFGKSSTLGPGETIRVYVDGNPRNDTRLVRYSGVDKLEFPNPGGFATFENWQGRRIACDAWASGHC